jgi:NAD(P)-dependent dehydrogenase (short-subunit alcohol dehydrogenase family)
MMGLHGKVVVIAGGRGALGQTVTPAFAKAGARVIVIDRHAAGQPQAGELGIDADVTDQTSVARAIGQALDHAGRLDCLVNLVGAFASGRLAETSPATWNTMISLNLTAGFLLSQAVIPHFSNQRAGRILHIAARAGQDPFPGAAAYIVAKSGLMTLIRVLALELAGSGVTINGILPTTIDTPANRTSMPNVDSSTWVKPEAIAEALTFLASDAAQGINGALIPIGTL